MNEEVLTIRKFMVDDMELKGTELLLFAYIYTKTNKGKLNFVENCSSIACKIKSTRESVSRTLCKLSEKGYLKKHSNTGCVNIYRCNVV